MYEPLTANSNQLPQQQSAAVPDSLQRVFALASLHLLASIRYRWSLITINYCHHWRQTWGVPPLCSTLSVLLSSPRILYTRRNSSTKSKRWVYSLVLCCFGLLVFFVGSPDSFVNETRDIDRTFPSVCLSVGYRLALRQNGYVEFFSLSDSCNIQHSANIDFLELNFCKL